MRKKLIAANWKMNKTVDEALAFIKEFKFKSSNNVDVVICPPAIALEPLSKKSKVKLGAQNCYFEEKGAFTGELSPDMIKGLADYVILGHSERRQIFNESDEIINKKVLLALKTNLKPILCIGETLDERESDKTTNIVISQLNQCLEGVTKEQIKNIIIAYEPIWAIGTGKTASPQQAQEVHEVIRSFLRENYDEKTAKSTLILYGGSMKPENAEELLKQKDIDGGLIGGASLDHNKFSKIINIAVDIVK